MRKITLLTLSLFFSAWAHAATIDFNVAAFEGYQNVDTNDYFSISEIIVTEIETLDSYDDKDIAGDIGSVITIVDKLIALGQKVWPIIKAGKPVINNGMNNFKPIYVLPEVAGQDAAFTFYSMSDWDMPVSKSYRVSYKNGFGAEVIGFNYTVLGQGGGKYEGKGSYVGNVQVVASNISVAWGFEFSADVSFVNAMNLGSMDNPVAGAMLKIDYKAKSLFKEIESSEIFTINGHGTIQKN